MSIINAAIQVVPLRHLDAYPLIDRAIELIQESGLPHRVGPFQTTVEGSYEEVTNLIGRIKDQLLENGLDDLLVNVQLQFHSGGDVRMVDKVGKYDPGS